MNENFTISKEAIENSGQIFGPENISGKVFENFICVNWIFCFKKFFFDNKKILDLSRIIRPRHHEKYFEK